jgi:Inositol monophosphatase family
VRSTCASRPSPAVERALRERIGGSRPGEGVFGEEEGGDDAGVGWVIDPIDGTKNFSRGVPVWATLIALEREDQVVCGVISSPALGHRWWAARGEGAFRDGERIRVSAVSRLADASVSSTYGRDLVAVERAVWHARSLGDFWQHALVAEGSVDAAVDARLAPGRAFGARLGLGHHLLGDLEDARARQVHDLCDLDPPLADAVADACSLEQLAVAFGIANRRHCLLRQVEPSDEAAKPATLVGRPHVFDPTVD